MTHHCNSRLVKESVARNEILASCCLLIINEVFAGASIQYFLSCLIKPDIPG